MSAAESWRKGGEAPLLGEAEFGDRVAQGGPGSLPAPRPLLPVGRRDSSVPCEPLFDATTLGTIPVLTHKSLGEKRLVSFSLFFQTRKCPMNIRISECFCTSVLKDGQSLLASGEMGAAAETGDLVEAAEEARGFLSLGQKSRQHHSPRSSGSQRPSLCDLRP